ncbi:MAG: hypothetical protein JWM74_5740 [Myxococcaceae bacterium]|nr:hypothetical protein [Myxococcaceae bacterium]
MLDAVHKTGRAEDDHVLDGLSPALRSELTRVAGTLSQDDKKRLATDPGMAKMRPLLTEASLPESGSTLYGICCARTMARELLGAYARPSDPKPLLASSVREVRHRAAIAYVRRVRSSLAAGGHLDADGADMLREVADSLGHSGLSHAAAERALALAPTPIRRGAAISAAASDFRVVEARAHLDALRADAPLQRYMDAFTSELEDAARFEKLGGEQATGEPALEAALRAARLGRTDVAQGLLDRSKVPYPSDLRAAAARTIIVYGRNLDVGLGTGDAATHAAFQSGDPALAKVRDDLDTAFATKKGRIPEALEVVMGAMVFASVDSLGSEPSPAVFERLVSRFRRLRDVASLPEMPATPRRDAVVLAVDAQLAAYENILSKSDEGLAVPGPARAGLQDRATRLIEASPASSPVAHATLAVAVALQWGTSDDTLPMFDKLTKTRDTTPIALDDLEPTRVLLEQWISLSHDHADRLEKVRLRLEEVAAARGGHEGWRLALQARELALRTAPAADVEKTFPSLVAVCAYDKMPPDADADDHLDAAMARAGVLWRMGRTDDARKAYESAVDANIASQGASPPVVAAFELFGTVLRGSSKEPAARRKAIAELERRRATLESADLGFYADTWIVWLAAAPDACEKKDATCRTETAALAAAAKKRLVEAPKPGSARREGIARGIVAIAGSAHAGIGYSTREGVIMNPFVTSRLAVLPPPSITPAR